MGTTNIQNYITLINGMGKKDTSTINKLPFISTQDIAFMLTSSLSIGTKAGLLFLKVKDSGKSNFIVIYTAVKLSQREREYRIQYTVTIPAWEDNVLFRRQVFQKRLPWQTSCSFEAPWSKPPTEYFTSNLKQLIALTKWIWLTAKIYFCTPKPHPFFVWENKQLVMQQN